MDKGEKAAQKEKRKKGTGFPCKSQIPFFASLFSLYLIDTNTEAIELMDTLVKQMAKAEGVTEELKRRDQLGWVGRMNNIRNRAEEIVRNELIYV